MADFNLDTDGDGLIDILEDTIGSNKNNAFTYNASINDALYYNGWYYNSATPTSIVNPSTAPTQFQYFEDNSQSVY